MVRRSFHRNEGGFSFLELMESVTILLVGLLGLSSLTIGTIQGNGIAKRVTSGAVVAQDKIEEIRATAYDAIVADSDQVTVDGVTYDRVWTVCDACPIARTKEILVTVSWSDQEDREVTVETIVAE
jgi:Tfp pilus assembly protein PilV